ncbi:MAG TPA: serine/threonine-protein kinase [Pirellulales bacterium]|jgi:serine/threonine protein kinase
MAEQTAESIAQRAFDLNLLTDRQLQEIWGEFGRRNVTVDEFVQLLLRRELLTNFQLERLLRGERGGYFYGDYKVLYLVAGGSFARVYRAVHKDSGKVVALKVLRRRYCEDPAQTDQFYREGLMGVSLRHPNIVPIFEAVSKGNLHYLVMEFVEGGNLRDFMKVRKKFSPTEATKIATDIAAGLDYAYQRGISHRDLKLTNVLLSSRGQAKLVDFGLAGADERIADESITAETLNARTIDYAGLERATGVRKDDARSDIYFIGCIFYHMLSGKAPLVETRDRIQRLSKSRYTGVEPIHLACPGVPRVVAAVVNKAMSLEADKRFQTPGQMHMDLRMAGDRMAAGEDEACLGTEDITAASMQQLSPADQMKKQREVAQYLPDSQRRALLVVESNSQVQDTFRDALKRYGYRVLVISDAKRALARCEDTQHPIDGVILSSGELKDAVVDAFVDLASGEQTGKVPTVILLDEKHPEWHARIQPHLADHRVVVPLPVKLKAVRDVLFRLVPPVATAET